MKKVTIIIPVYKDWKTLSLCIESLKKYLDSRHTVMLVNDCSNEADELESNILSSIVGYQNFQYFRNPHNMGFVKTCNRAVFELDKTDNDVLLLNSDTEVTNGFLEEMLEVLYLTEKHGVVCPRSNCATIFTVPVHNNDYRNLTPEESYKCYTEVRDMLPRYSIMPTGVGFCFLIKRRLIQLYNLFDEIYGLGYNEENDFCMRISQYGWNVIAANRAYVFHYESRSFGNNKKKLDEQNRNILLKRYPYYDSLIYSYFNRKIYSTDYFADLLCQDFYQKKSILISLYNLPPVFNGTAVFGLEFLKNFTIQFKDKYDIFILTNRAGADFHNLSKLYKNIYYPDTINRTFDIAYVPSQIFNIEHLFILNRHCLRFVFCMQDIIALRCNYILNQNWEQEEFFRQSIHFADGMTTISNFTTNDTKAYFDEEFISRNIPVRKIYHASDKKVFNLSSTNTLPFKKYFLVFGNHYKHKMIDDVIQILEKIDSNFIVFGSSKDGKIAENIYGIRSGIKEDSFMCSLLSQSTGIIFPSVYEGFGLINLDARDFGKKIIVYNNELNNELFTQCIPEHKDNVRFFNRLEDIPELVMEIEKKSDIILRKEFSSSSNRITSDVAKETEQFLDEILKLPVDLKKLQERWIYYRYLENVHRCYGSIPEISAKQLLKKWIKTKNSLFKIAKFIKKIVG